MELCEYQNKRLLRENKIPVLKGRVAYTVEEAVEIAKEMDCNSWRLHVQLPLGEKIVEYIPPIMGNLDAHSIEMVENLARDLFSKTVVTSQNKKSLVQRIYVEELCEIEEQVSLSMRIDTQTQRTVFCIKSKRKVSECELPCAKPTVLFWCRILKMFHFKNVQEARILPILKQMYAFFVKYDVLAMEFNPLVLTKKGKWVVLDARIIFDDEALFRYPEIAKMRETPLGQEREEKARLYNFRYLPFDGNIACLVNGSGLGAATIDLIVDKGGKPACLLDVGTEPTKESVFQALKLALSEPNVEGVFVNIFGGITRCDVIADGLISASQEISVGMPLVVRMDGTNAQVGSRLLFDSHLPLVVLKDLDEAANMIIHQVEELL